MRSLGRLLQLAGLIILPAAMFLELNHNLGREYGVADMLLMLGFGFAIFYIGRFIEGYGKR